MGQGHKMCSILALMRHYDGPETREEFLKLFYVGNVPEEIPGVPREIPTSDID